MNPVYIVMAKSGSPYNGEVVDEWIIYAGLSRDKAIKFAYDSGNENSYNCCLQTWVGKEMIIEEKISEIRGE